jgi:hypothetical protein
MQQSNRAKSSIWAALAMTAVGVSGIVTTAVGDEQSNPPGGANCGRTVYGGKCCENITNPDTHCSLDKMADGTTSTISWGHSTGGATPSNNSIKCKYYYMGWVDGAGPCQRTTPVELREFECPADKISGTCRSSGGGPAVE